MSLIGRTPVGLGIASGTLLANLLDALIAKGTLSESEVRTLLIQTTSDLTPYPENSAKEALDIIRELLVRFPENETQKD